ncbi:MAG: ProFAR isomerase-like protein [Barrevirus sp.]|uniref:ProFAR isomerase-like protein n=1 Tax=Barrevirus sp. TaxID=2487763 RepID=A0A3G4ZQ09_9VIRU|nr:MAG: ProFAR isomerase-like protein [Barrevirus sp.]
MSTIHECNLSSPHFENIKESKKIYEIRILDEKRKRMKVSDTLIFYHNSDKEKIEPIRTKIVEIKVFNSFVEALEGMDLSNILPGQTEMENCVRIYEEIPGYSELAKLLGVVRFKIILL